RSTIDRGVAELRGDAAPEAAPDRVRRKGGGRRPLVVTDPTLLTDLKDLVEPRTRGDPTAPLLWTARSLRNLAAGLRELGDRIGECWHRQRYGELRSQLHSALVPDDGARSVSARDKTSDHRRLWRQQWRAGAPLETRAANPGQRTRHRHHGLPFAPRHQQMEQD